MPLQRKPDLHNQYSKTNEDCENNLKIIDDDDLLFGLDQVEIETPDELMSDLGSFDPDDSPSEPAPPVDDWLIAVRELARKHGPFETWQIVQIIRALNAPSDETIR